MDTSSMAHLQASGRGDAQLLADADGSRGLRVLYERHFDAVFRYAAARIGRQAAEDVVAETFVIAFTRRAAFDRRYASALPWLIGIATNLLRSRRRTERRHLAGDPDRIDARGATDPGLDGALDRVDAAASHDAVVRAVRRLAPSEREAFLVHAFVGLEGAELGVALGISPSAAAVRLHRARSRLRAALPANLVSQEESE